MIYVIEHLEPKLWPWCIIEYKHISKIAGKNNVWFTNIKKKDFGKLNKFGRVFEESVKNMNLRNACVLDPESDILLKSKEAPLFSYFILGGILGDYPPRKRTEIELTKFIKNAKVRNIGKDQLSTDNAVFVTNEICRGKELSEIDFIDEVEVRINKIESTILPFKYPLVKGKPNISKELVKYLKEH